MKYIIGYTSYEYAILGIRIPKKSNSRLDQPGDLGVTAVTEEQLKALEETKLFQRLVAAKSIKVLETRPSWSVSSAEKIDDLQQENARLKAELEKSKKQPVRQPSTPRVQTPVTPRPSVTPSSVTVEEKPEAEESKKED